MTSNQQRALQDLGTRLEWVYPTEDDLSLTSILTPLFSWADQGDAAGARKDAGLPAPIALSTRREEWCRLQDSNL